jgi:hypothetical protein
VEDELIVSGEAKLTPGCRSIRERLWEGGGRICGLVDSGDRRGGLIVVVKEGRSVGGGRREQDDFFLTG